MYTFAYLCVNFCGNFHKVTGPDYRLPVGKPEEGVEDNRHKAAEFMACKGLK